MKDVLKKTNCKKIKKINMFVLINAELMVVVLFLFQ